MNIKLIKIKHIRCVIPSIDVTLKNNKTAKSCPPRSTTVDVRVASVV